MNALYAYCSADCNFRFAPTIANTSTEKKNNFPLVAYYACSTALIIERLWGKPISLLIL